LRAVSARAPILPAGRCCASPCGNPTRCPRGGGSIAPTPSSIHLATALLWREADGTALAMATHDVALALAARAHGLPVVGVAGV